MSATAAPAAAHPVVPARAEASGRTTGSGPAVHRALTGTPHRAAVLHVGLPSGMGAHGAGRTVPGVSDADLDRDVPDRGAAQALRERSEVSVHAVPTGPMAMNPRAGAPRRAGRKAAAANGAGRTAPVANAVGRVPAAAGANVHNRPNGLRSHGNARAATNAPSKRATP